MALPGGNFVDAVLGTTVAAFNGNTTGTQAEDQGLQPVTQPWTDEWFLKTGLALMERHHNLQPDSNFVAGDDVADRRALSYGIDPHARNTGWERIAQSQLGVPYVWADANPAGPAGGPGSGFDCSGYTQWYAKRAFGVDLPHLSTDQAKQLPAVSRDQLKPGDLVFMSYGRLGAGVIDHVGIYAGNGQMYVAPSAGENVQKQAVDWNAFVQGGSLGASQAPSRGRRTTQMPSTKLYDPLTVPFANPDYFTGAITPILKKPMTGEPRQPGSSRVAKSGEDPVVLGKRMAANQYGWTGAQWDALHQLWDRESGWSPTAVNSSSGAVGIPQLLPSAHDVPAGYRKSAAAQLQWGMNYIQQRYGDPVAALAHENEAGWY
jgi:cell wall-associated NlpC family hydrolase